MHYIDLKIFGKRFSFLAAFLSPDKSHFSSRFLCGLLLFHFNGQWCRQYGFHIQITAISNSNYCQIANFGNKLQRRDTTRETDNLHAKSLPFLILFFDFHFKSRCKEYRKLRCFLPKNKRMVDSRTKKIITYANNDMRIQFFVSPPPSHYDS